MTSAHDAVVWDVAGDRIAAAAAAQMRGRRRPRRAVQEQRRRQGRLVRHPRELPGARATSTSTSFARRLTPHLVSRQVVVGAGRVGLGAYGDTPGFQISQRADYIEAEVGLETTLRRPIVNTRDEPHADRAQVAPAAHHPGRRKLAWKCPPTSRSARPPWCCRRSRRRTSGLTLLALADPVAEVSAVSRDLTLRHRLRLALGRDRRPRLRSSARLLTIARDYVARCRRRCGVGAVGATCSTRLARDLLRGSARRRVGGQASAVGTHAGALRAPSTRKARACLPRGTTTGCRAADVQWSELGTGLAARLAAAGAVDRADDRRGGRRRDDHCPPPRRARG